MLSAALLQAHKEGDVKAVYDKAIAKQTVVIGGATSASNYIQVPATKNLPKASLGLIGKYVNFISDLKRLLLSQRASR